MSSVETLLLAARENYLISSVISVNISDSVHAILSMTISKGADMPLSKHHPPVLLPKAAH